MSATLGLETRAGRCPCGFALPEQASLHSCNADKDADYERFRSLLNETVRADGTIHACDMRPRTAGAFEPRRLSSLWKRARNERVLVEAGTERSNDEAGKNAGRWEPYYELRAGRMTLALIAALWLAWSVPLSIALGRHLRDRI